jgi:hypothetical protein
LFPTSPDKGDLFIRVDVLPNKLFRFTSDKWIEIPKTRTSSYLGNQEYLDHLISDVNAGRINIEQLTEDEREEIARLLDD